MRLIAGFLHLDGQPAAAARLDAMAAAMTEPGLNPAIIRHVDGPIALLTLDFDQTVAPGKVATEGAGSLVLAADLRMDGPDGVNDAPALAQLLDREGTGGLDRLSGDFAFAAWDGGTRQLTCARDAFGVRPLFIAHQPDRLFAFASLPRGLHASGLVERVLDEDAVIAHLLLHPMPPSRSLFQGVTRLEPGSWLRLGPGSPPIQGRHWRPTQRDVGWRRLKPADAAAELSALVTNAVHRRLPAQGPVAAHLSGGLDSSAITVLAARALRPTGRRLLAYSLVPAPFGSHQFGGEGAFLAPVRRQEPDIIWRPVMMEDPIAAVLPHMDSDGLFPDDPRSPEVQIMVDAAARGARMLLSGWGGDDCATYGVGEHGLLAEALLTGQWWYLAAELRQTGSVRAAARALLFDLWPSHVCRPLRNLIRKSPPNLRQLATRMLQPGRGDAWPQDFVPQPLLARHQRLCRLYGYILPLRAENWALQAARQGMAVSFPLLDRQVVEFALSLPSTLFLRGGWPRRLFRDAMAGILPAELCWKRGKLDLNSAPPLHLATQRQILLERLAEWRHHPRIAAMLNLDRMEDILRGLPDAETMASIAEDSRSSRAENLLLSQAFVLQRCLPPLVYLAGWD